MKPIENIKSASLLQRGGKFPGKIGISMLCIVRRPHAYDSLLRSAEMARLYVRRSGIRKKRTAVLLSRISGTDEVK